ncbi:hypothetical protein [Streptococcus loxodontisalivarius]|uniref:Chemotaxis protein histidine kinase CheA n=1 Tax=Streptococcus loxodontisalivarius TaxID=1349415 RepID=A0ABS2PU71_9STRE|nr:hypothetical protein [Streptococcus loxodontisalivarius]MBM7643608.1 chemotaxis protein histidine kinase CheA [Streptococcus loxodontisalivarius]
MKKNKSLILTSLLLGLFGAQLANPQLVTPQSNQIVYAATNSEAESNAEKAVKTLEDNQNRDNLAKAKEKVAALSTSTSKEKLEKRIAAVEQAIIIKEAKAAVKRLEDNQNRDNLASAQAASDQVKDAGTKANLTNRINKVSQAITIKEAQAAVKHLEDNQTRDNVSPAQDATNKVSDPGTKANLENRINAVQNAINIREAEAQAQANAEKAVKNLEDNQTRENQASAQAAVDSVTDANKKAAWQHRINLVDAAISSKEAQAAAAAQAAQAAQAARDAQAASQSQVQSSGGYTRDYRGRWHRANGQYASKAEIAAAGLPW